MGKDVILTKAVVAGAFAAIAELQIGIIGIRPAADGALVMKAALLLLLFDSLLEMYRLTGVLVLFAFGKVMYLGIDKRKEVHARDRRED